MNQIFRKEPPFDLLMTVLNKYCDRDGEKYIVDYVTFKRIVFHDYHYKWLFDLRSCYHNSKAFYVTRPFTFTSFINVIRQLCKVFNVKYKYSYDRNQNYHHLKYTITL